MALLYYHGRAVTRNYVEAYYWAKIAALNGNANGLNNLHRFAIKLQPAIKASADQRVAEWMVKNPKPLE